MTQDIESAVRQLLARSADCVWRKDLHGYGACWASDGEWKILGQSFQGREAVKAAWSQFMNPLKAVWQTAQNPCFEFEATQGYGRIYLEETLFQPDGSVNCLRGVYHDTYKIENGAWVFAKRHIDMAYLGPYDLSGKFFGTPDFGPAPRDCNPNRPASPSLQEAYGQ